MPQKNLTQKRAIDQSKHDDHNLIDAVAKGDRDAFQILYRRHYDRVLCFLIGMLGTQAQAEDIVNEVFLAAWRSAARFEGRSQPLTWLMSIARNQAISALRKRREVSGIFDEVAYNLADQSDTPEVSAERSADADLLRRCVDQLSPAHQKIVDLVYYQDYSVSEAAELLAVPPNTVKTRMFYARKKLSGMLEVHQLAAA